MTEVAWYVLAALAIVGELGMVMFLTRRARATAWRCGRVEGQLAMMHTHVLRLAGATTLYSSAVASGDEAAAHRARRELDQACWAAQATMCGAMPTWLHERRRTTYYLLADRVRMNMSGPVQDGDSMCLYVDTETGRLSVRRSAEFRDGRFRRLDNRDEERLA